jgi:tripartite-type tricarboxylate transporter receptor subunit TctC
MRLEFGMHRLLPATLAFVALSAIALSAIALSALPARAQSVEEFYKGKTINLAIGFSVGGGYDLYARHLARHMGKHIPGNPAVVPQNMAGAGSLRAANFIYTAAPKDGTAFGTFARTTGINPLLDSGATFDATKFSWLGSVTDDVSLCVAWHTSPVKTWKDMLEKPITLGGQGPS